MRRRGFLQALGGLFAGAALPALPLPVDTVGRAFVGWKVYTKAVILNEGWMCVIEKAAPAYTFNDDPDWGVFRGAGGDIRFVAGVVEVLNG